ncbi:MAG: DUF2520 domain-containing protein [Eubacterium sp.]|nr:DUF2520 domain-containing protein [Eubacterium sp.]
MKIGFIGAGKVGFSLGRYLKENEYTLSGYYSKSPASAEDAAKFCETNSFDTMKQLVEVSDVLFLTVPDGEIASVWERLKEIDICNKIICHTSGALSSEVFSGMKDRSVFGFSVHPILAISDKYESYKDLKSAFFTIEGSKEKLAEVAGVFKHCQNKVALIDANSKIKYHAACSIVSNFAVMLADVAKDMLLESGFSEENVFEAIGPLIVGNAENIVKKGTKEALTGPIERGDVQTVLKHISVLKEDDKRLYKEMAKRTLVLAENKHPERNYENMAEVLK